MTAVPTYPFRGSRSRGAHTAWVDRASRRAGARPPSVRPHDTKGAHVADAVSHNAGARHDGLVVTTHVSPALVVGMGGTPIEFDPGVVLVVTNVIVAVPTPLPADRL